MSESSTKEYRAYVRMLHRCHNPDYPDYRRYGARGILVCQRWRESYQSFLEDMGRAPSPAHTIERQNNDKGYHPGNCVWATRKEQGNNRSTSVRVTFRGLTKTMAEWADFLGCSRKKLWKRRKLWGDDWERVLSPWPTVAPAPAEPRAA